jgi:predicted ATP-grasp superfamily ATP-dependent carboligase
LFEHIAACRGELSANVTPHSPVRAFRIVYAPRAIVISERLAWPRWCADRPSAGTAIRAGEPLCTVQAEGEDRRETEALLKTRETEIQVCLGLLP